MKSKTINSIATFLIFGIAVLMGFYLGKHLTSLKYTDIIWAVVFFFLSLFLLIHLHELGHLFFGKLAGYKLILYKVGPFCWKLENGRFKFETEKMKGYAGLCMMIPPADGASRNANLLYYAGGVLMNLLTGIIALLFAFLTPGISILLFLALGIFGMLSIGTGILNLRPAKSQNNPTDGMILWSVWQGEDFAEGFALINRLQMELSMGTRPRDLNFLNDEKENTSDPYLRIYILIYLLYKAWDTDNKEKIKIYADKIRGMQAQIPSAIEDAVKFELCAAYAFTGETEKAETYYSESKAKLEKENDSNGNRIKAFYAWYIESDGEKALAFCRQGLAVIETYPLKGQALMERDLMEGLLMQIQNSRL